MPSSASPASCRQRCTVGGLVSGPLNLYSLRENAFSTEDIELAGILADQSAALMAALTSEEGLREALQTRTLIGQAQGILMERFELDADQAFSVLRRFSQDSNVRLRDIAELLVRSGTLPQGRPRS